MTIIMAGDLNCTKEALEEDMSIMYFDHLTEDRHTMAENKGNLFAISDGKVKVTSINRLATFRSGGDFWD